MTRVRKNKALGFFTKVFIKNTKLDMVVYEEDVILSLNKEQYDKTKASFDSGKFKYMNEDAELADLCEMPNTVAKLLEGEQIWFEYPTKITDGMSFDEVVKAIKPKAVLEKEINEMVESAIAKSQKIWDRLSGDEEEEKARLDAIDELQDWMEAKGFDGGILNCRLEDSEGYCIECLDLGWPHGISNNKGFFKPIAVQFYHTTDEQLRLAKEQGFDVFLSIEEFKAYIEKII